MVRPAGSAEFKTFTDPKNAARTLHHEVLIDPGRPLYAAYYNETTQDHWGRIYISYSYFPDALTANEASVYQTKYSLPTMTKTTCSMSTFGDDGANHATADVERCSYAEVQPRDHLMLMQPAGSTAWKLTTTSDFWY
jgi:hypothetical protein